MSKQWNRGTQGIFAKVKALSYEEFPSVLLYMKYPHQPFDDSKQWDLGLSLIIVLLGQLVGQSLVTLWVKQPLMT